MVNEGHPSGGSFPADTSPGFSYAAPHAGQYEQAAHDFYPQQGQAVGYDGYSSGTFGDHGFSYDADPLFGSMPGQNTGMENTSWTSGSYDAYSGQSGTYEGGAFDGGGYDTGTYTSGSYDTGAAWTNAGFPQTADVPAQPDPNQADFGWGGDGRWDASQWDTSQWNNAQWDTDGQWDLTGVDGGWDAYGYGQPAVPQGHDGAADPFQTQVQAQTQAHEHPASYESGELYESYDGYEPGLSEGYDLHGQQQLPYGDEAFTYDAGPDATTALPALDGYENPEGYESHEGYDNFDFAAYDGTASHDGQGGYDAYGADGTEAPAHAHADEPDSGPGSRPDLDAPGARPRQDLRVANLPGRRRSPRPRRSALLTVAVPSVAVMGVAAAAAATVADTATQEDQTTTQAADVPVKPANKKLDTQLAGLSADADDFADRASRTQERLDLQARQEAERERKAKAAARKEALRPKFALPVSEHGLSATYGQAGLNWMSVHTGIDFPVSEGTPVMAATDGTVTTKYDVAFGNMAVVTAPDGTETWYCHLSSTKIRGGQVKAGDTIGYSGTSGNSTGPHLHFEVHPGGGEAIDPLPWLRGKGLNPQ